ncbi:MAG: HAMP domain-containing histidine kinase [Eubacterium sp.]|nr:HAMP domain-containing histidine kinase [Eubacterium sp.]
MNNSLVKLRRQFIITMMSIVTIFLVTIFAVQCISSWRTTRTISDNALKIAMDRLARNNWKESDSDFFPWFMPENDDNLPERPDSTDSSDESAPAIPDVFPQGGRMMDNFGDRTTRTAVLVVKVDEAGNVTSVRNEMFYMGDSYIDEVVKETPYETKESYEPSTDLSADPSTDFANGSPTRTAIKTYHLPDYHLRYAVHREGSDTYIAYVDQTENDSTLADLIKNAILISLAVIIVMFILSLFLSKRVLHPVEKAWEDQKRFVADASHELKTPLAVVLSNTDMVIKSKDKNSEKNMKRLDNIKNESDRMKELVSELLEVARGDLSNKELIREDVNLSELTEDIILVWDPICYEADRTLENDIEEDLHITGDPSKLRRLIDILIDNAIKYSFEKSTISVSLKKSSKHINLVVTNKGTPLSEDECRKIFERFYRADKSRESTPGYGLGLAIAESVTAEHNGHITASSDGIDTNTFTVRFRLQ